MEQENNEDELMDTPPEIREQATTATNNLLPEKSRFHYERAYNLFSTWCNENRIKNFSEDVVLAYFQKLSANKKPSSLWCIYSMLRSTLNLKNNIDISKYPKVCLFLKRASEGYKSKKSNTLTPQQIQEFLTTAPDEKYLFIKVGLIFGVMGDCRRDELIKIEINHVEDLNTALIVHIPDTKTKTERQFVIGGNLYKICKKYIQLRPPNLPSTMSRFFLNYQRGKCTKQPIGINKFGIISREIAQFLNLPHPASYTGHSLRRSSAILVDTGDGIRALKLRGRWRSTTIAEGIARLKNENQERTKQSEQCSSELTTRTEVQEQERKLPEHPRTEHEDVSIKIEEHKIKLEQFEFIDVSATTTEVSVLETADSENAVTIYQNKTAAPNIREEDVDRLYVSATTTENPVLETAASGNGVTIYQNKTIEPNIEEEDEDRLFLLSLLPSFKKLDPIKKIGVRIEMLSSIQRSLSS